MGTVSGPAGCLCIFIKDATIYVMCTHMSIQKCYWLALNNQFQLMIWNWWLCIKLFRFQMHLLYYSCYFKICRFIQCHYCFPIHQPFLTAGVGVLSRWTGQTFPGEVRDGPRPASPASGADWRIVCFSLKGDLRWWVGKNMKQTQNSRVKLFLRNWQWMYQLCIIIYPEFDLEKIPVGNDCQHF